MYVCVVTTVSIATLYRVTRPYDCVCLLLETVPPLLTNNLLLWFIFSDRYGETTHSFIHSD